jgi:hypothetical protein
MRKFLLASVFAIAGIGPVIGADLPVKAPLRSAIAPVSVSPFYLDIFGGGGWSQVENELTILGTSQGPIKAFPTGLLVGAGIGARWNLNPLVVGIDASAAYNFSKAGVGCGPDVAVITGNQCLGYRKDGLLFQQGGELGINLGTLFGYIPTGAQPANWPVPITVPASVMGNLTATVRGGIAERDLTMCATAIDITGTISQPCGSKFVIGPYVGGKIGAAISQNVEAYVRVDHIFWNSSFTPAQDPRVSAIFANSTRATGETLAVAGIAVHFCPGC